MIRGALLSKFDETSVRPLLSVIRTLPQVPEQNESVEKFNTMIEFSEPWHACSDPYFEDELHRELCREHVLHGIDAKIIARRQDMDDFLFELSDGRFANVHLTWSKETEPMWPSTEIYDSRIIMEREIQSHIDEWNDLGSH